MLKIGALASGGGTNLQAIIDAVERKDIPAEIAVVISNISDAYALERAKKHGIDAACILHKGKTREEHEAEILKVLKGHDVGLVVLAGYLRMLTPSFVREYKGRIMNIHPALLPSFGGPGMHGEHVHRAVIERGCKVSGCTVHFVEEGVDTGPIIVQRCVPVNEGDDEKTLAARILEEEHKAYPEAVRLFAEGRLKIDGKRVIIGDKK
jgi:phosphoribosylglycinamide formyltransferase-1